MFILILLIKVNYLTGFKVYKPIFLKSPKDKINNGIKEHRNVIYGVKCITNHLKYSNIIFISLYYLLKLNYPILKRSAIKLPGPRRVLESIRDASPSKISNQTLLEG